MQGMSHKVFHGATFTIQTITNSDNYDCSTLPAHHRAVKYDRHGEFYGETLLPVMVRDVTITRLQKLQLPIPKLHKYFHVINNKSISKVRHVCFGICIVSIYSIIPYSLKKTLTH